jgi:hypothetical protein
LPACALLLKPGLRRKNGGNRSPVSLKPGAAEWPLAL